MSEKVVLNPARPPAIATDCAEADQWLAEFHQGSRAVMQELYRTHFDRVSRTVGTILDGADRETTVHEVFFRLLTSERLRQAYQGGSFGSWIATVARNQAIDYQRRRRFEIPSGMSQDLPEMAPLVEPMEARLDAAVLVQRFRDECLPKKWQSVFEARFIKQLSQAEAAEQLGLARTTLVYQEIRVRRLLRQFFIGHRS